MTASLALPIPGAADPVDPSPVRDWHIVPAKSRIRFATGPFLATIRGTLPNATGVVRLIEGQARYTHVDVRVPLVAHAWLLKWMGLDADLYPFVSFYGWRVRGNPRRSFALDGELRIGEFRRQVALNASATGQHLDGSTDTEEATYHTQFTVDLNSGRRRSILGRRIRVLVDITLAR